MKWLKSTTNNSYTAQGKVIPPVTSHPIQITESEYDTITKMAVIKSLIDTGGILVLDKYAEQPDADSATRKLQALSTENAKLSDRIRELEASTQGSEEVEAAKKAQADAEAKLAELQAKYAELEKEANEKISALAAEANATTSKKSKKGAE